MEPRPIAGTLRIPPWSILAAAVLGPAGIFIAWSELFDYVGRRSGIRGSLLSNVNNALFMLLAIVLVLFVWAGGRVAAANGYPNAFRRIAAVLSVLGFAAVVLGNLAG